MSFREGVKYFLDGFRDLGYYESKGAIAFIIFTVAPIIFLIVALVRWLRS